MSAPFHVLAWSGSLRAGSSNRALLQAAAALAPASLRLIPLDGWGGLPAFNPDLENTDDAQVRRLRLAVQQADAVLIACPEYAHGLPGAFKNALDWLVGSGELINKPVAAFNASGRAVHAQAALLETLAMMTADLVMPASQTIALPGNQCDAAAILADPGLCELVRQALAALEQHLLARQQTRPD